MSTANKKMMQWITARQFDASKLRKLLMDKRGSVTGDMGMWIVIIAAVAMLIITLVVPYVRNQFFPSVTGRVDDILNFD